MLIRSLQHQLGSAFLIASLLACGGSDSDSDSSDNVADTGVTQDTGATSDATSSADTDGTTDTGVAADTAADTTPAEPLNVNCQEVTNGFGPDGTTALEVEIVASGLAIPWAVDWLPDGSMLVTERSGALRRVAADGTLLDAPVANVAITTGGEGGLLGLAVSPDFETNRAIYIYYTSNADGTVHNRVER
ncbi:MAG: PQQ-dependent sugar dehydrogenase, partial [Myxococcota bacterium]